MHNHSVERREEIEEIIEILQLGEIMQSLHAIALTEKSILARLDQLVALLQSQPSGKLQLILGPAQPQ